MKFTAVLICCRHVCVAEVEGVPGGRDQLGADIKGILAATLKLSTAQNMRQVSHRSGRRCAECGAFGGSPHLQGAGSPIHPEIM